MHRSPSRETVAALREAEAGGGEMVFCLDDLLCDARGFHPEVETGAPVGNEFLAESAESRTMGYMRRWLDHPGVKAILHRKLKP